MAAILPQPPQCDNMACHPGGDYWDYYPGTLFLHQVTATHLKIWHPWISSVGTRFHLRVPDLAETLDNMTGYQGSVPKNGWQDMHGLFLPGIGPLHLQCQK